MVKHTQKFDALADELFESDHFVGLALKGKFGGGRLLCVLHDSPEEE